MTLLRDASTVSITSTGGVLLGSMVACDGFAWNHPIGAISHAHLDHLVGLEQLLGSCEPVLVTRATKSLLVALKGDWLKLHRNLVEVDYRNRLRFGDESITLFPANHMLGAAQVLVETKDGSRLVYTGDFNSPGTPPLKSDILVVDSTYGSPRYDFDWIDRKAAQTGLLDVVSREIRKRNPIPIHVYSSRGRLQEIMDMFRREGIDLPYVTSDRDLAVAGVYENFGRLIGEIYSVSSESGASLIRDGKPHIGFFPKGSDQRRSEHCIVAAVTTHNALGPIQREGGGKRFRIAMTDHADFNGILEYVGKSDPDVVITNTLQQGYLLAEEIEGHLGIRAIPSPD